MRFFIFSLPRSGSAWLANFLSGSQVFCFHEPLAESPIEGLPALLERPYPVVGAIDTLAYTRAREIKRTLKDTQFYVLYRDLEEIAASSAACGLTYDPLPQFQAFTAAARGCRAIHYCRLWDVRYLCELWSTIVGGGFDETRARQLIEMNVQRDIGKFTARLTQRQACTSG